MLMKAIPGDHLVVCALDATNNHSLVSCLSQEQPFMLFITKGTCRLHVGQSYHYFTSTSLLCPIYTTYRVNNSTSSIVVAFWWLHAIEGKIDQTGMQWSTNKSACFRLVIQMICCNNATPDGANPDANEVNHSTKEICWEAIACS